MITTFEGPVLVSRDNPQLPRGAIQNPDLGPSLFDLGMGTIDPRMGLNRMMPNGGLSALGIGLTGKMLLVDAVPAAVSTTNIAAAQAVTSGTPMTLVSASGNGINVLSSSVTIAATGAQVPAGTLCIDAIPALIFFNVRNSVAVPDPRTMIARAVSITGAASSPGGSFLVKGYDLYGLPQSETITVPAASTTAVTQNGKKGWKFISSVTPEFTSTYDYSVGTTDIYEFPIAVYDWSYVQVYWAGTLETANTGFVAADQTSPATSSTGSVRGTYALPTASNGTSGLHIWAAVAPYNLVNVNGQGSIFGVTPA